MQRTVEILLVIGIAVNLVKGVDLLLRPHQQKWLQSKWESLTLWLDYSRPIDWFFKKGKIRTIFWTVYIVVFPWIALRVISQVSGYSMWWWKVTWLIVFYLVLLFQVFESQQEAPTDLHAWVVTKTGAKLTNWLTSDATALQQMITLLLTALLGATLAALFFLGAYALSHTSEELALLLFLGCLTLTEVYSSAIAVALASSLVLICSILILLSEFALKGVRAIAWRIAEYSKGVLAAILLVLTIGLGLAEVYLKSSTK